MRTWEWLKQRSEVRGQRSEEAAARSKITLVYIQKTAVIDEEKLLEVFAVDPETPWLLAVLAVLAGREEIQKEQAATCELPDSQRAFFAGAVREMADAQEQILYLVKKGNEAKAGRRTTDGG